MATFFTRPLPPDPPRVMTRPAYDSIVYALVKEMIAALEQPRVWPDIRPIGSFNHERQLTHERIDQDIARIGVPLLTGDDMQPRYLPKIDRIIMPPTSCYEALNHYYAELFHECIHWTGPRLGRSSAAPDEEMIAEFGSAFMCHHYQLENPAKPSAYIYEHWIRSGEEIAAFDDAVEQAIAAVEYLHGLSIHTPG